MGSPLSDLHVGHALAEHVEVALRVAFACGYVRVRFQARNDHGVHAGRVLNANRDDGLVVGGVPPALGLFDAREANDHVIVAAVRTVHVQGRGCGQHPAFEGADGAQHTLLIFAKGFAIADFEGAL